MSTAKRRYKPLLQQSITHAPYHDYRARRSKLCVQETGARISCSCPARRYSAFLPLKLCFRSHLYILPKEFSDPPPSYSEGPDPPLASTSTSAHYPDPNINPSNFVYLSNTNSKIQGKWVVDPALVIPRTFLPPLSSGETELTRKNLSLRSTNGLVHADVFVLPTSADAILAKRLRERVLIHASSTNGRIQLNIVRNWIPVLCTDILLFFSTTVGLVFHWTSPLPQPMVVLISIFRVPSTGPYASN